MMARAGAVRRRERRWLAGLSAVDGFALGRAARFPTGSPATRTHGVTRSLSQAVDQVRRDLDALLAALPSEEAELFEPEALILAELEPRLTARAAAGQRLDDAVVAETSCGCTDLIVDLRMRPLGALESSHRWLAPSVWPGDEIVLVTDLVTPSLVASLPRQIVARLTVLHRPIGGRRDVGRTSHAAILARGRGLPLAYVSPADAASIPDGAALVVHTRDDGARVWVDPDLDFLALARRRRDALAHHSARAQARRAPLGHLGVEVRVNVGSPHEDVPACADGVGLVRTEAMFAGRLTAPGEAEQLAALLLVASKVRGAPIVVRLFDAGGDKPLPWLGGADASRGIERLLAHADVLATQLRAVARAREHADIRVLLPFVRDASQVEFVRQRAVGDVPLGAMIESPDAVDTIDPIASAADFISIGTNDLTATTLGLDRTEDAPVVDRRVLALVRRAVLGAHRRGRKATVCGELAADDRGARLVIGLGADALSVPTARVAAIRGALARTTRNTCRAHAREALGAGADRETD